MPGIAQKNAQFPNSSISPSPVWLSSAGIWSKNGGGNLTFDQLQKYWIELLPQARQKLMRIDKQTLFEQARKNLYCSRCNGLLLEGFSQIVMYGRSPQQEGAGGKHIARVSRNQIENGSDITSSRCQDVIQDPSVHPWGGLIATRDGMLTLLDCFLYGTSLMPLQNVFDSARARERERELLYPDACGGSGRGWISQGLTNYGRGHGIRETCALHTARLSCDTLVDFWSALGDETRQSLLRMKEEDFIDRLMYRFDSKRFCRDCRRNVIREFKELKELKRMRREPRCTNWFCVADTAFQYEVSKDTVLADWHQTFPESDGMYHHFEWAIGTGEGKSDILEFEDVGRNGSVEVNGLDLGDVNSFFITLRAWKLDGRCTELTVKAHALKGQPCVHRRLIVGDGFVTIVKGESIRRFFEHAEEAEEEEDDDSIDKDGNDLDADGSRPQKHAKSPELAREFLFDAATVVFKEQVEKAFREGTARQNAHSIFVCIALKLLEERVHVACKEIITLEKQIKLLEEEEKEKREEEERKERRRAKEREKKLRRKERLKGKEGEKDKRPTEAKQLPNGDIDTNRSVEAKQLPLDPKESSLSIDDESHSISQSDDSSSAIRVTTEPSSSPTSDVIGEQSSNEGINFIVQTVHDSTMHSCYGDEDINAREVNGCFVVEQSKSSRRKLKFRKDSPLEQSSRHCEQRQSTACNNSGDLVGDLESKSDGYKAASGRGAHGLYRQSRNNGVKSCTRNSGLKFSGKFHCSNSRLHDRYDLNSCNCNLIRSGKHFKTVNGVESTVDRPFNRSSKYTHGCHAPDTFLLPKGKIITGNFPSSTDVMNAQKLWEPMEGKKSPRNSSDPDVAPNSSTCKASVCNGVIYDGNKLPYKVNKSVHPDHTSECHRDSGQDGSSNCYQSDTCSSMISRDMFPVIKSVCNASDPITSTSSDNCSSCLSEGDSCTGSSGAQNAESLSTSDSEDTGLHSEGREVVGCSESMLCGSKDVTDDKCKPNEEGGSHVSGTSKGFMVSGGVNHYSVGLPTTDSPNSEYAKIRNDLCSHHHHHVQPMHNPNVHVPMFPAPSTMGGYYHQSAAWASAHTNGMVSYPQPNHYLFSGPLGYGLSMNQTSHFCMQYGGLQPLTAVINAGQLPTYHRSNTANIPNFNSDQMIISKLGGTLKPVTVQAVERPVTTTSKEGSPEKDGKQALVRTLKEDSAFSLFHFGGPIEVATGSCLNQLSLKDRAGDYSSKCLKVHPDQGDVSCTIKDTTVEEYSLFAASGGARFSFF